MTTPRERFAFGEDQAGRLRYVEHHRPGPVALLVLVVAPALVPLIFRSDLSGPAVALFYYGVGLLFLVLLYLSGWMNRTKVYDRAIVLDTAWPGGAPYVIPLATVDPHRVRYHRRANLIGRRLGQGRRNLRTGPYAAGAITFVGLSPRLARRRAGDPTWAAGERPPSTGRSMPVDDDGRLFQLELETWAVATGTPRRLLAAVEQALADAGRAGPDGMTERLLSRPVVERWRRPLTDEEIYAD